MRPEYIASRNCIPRRQAQPRTELLHGGKAAYFHASSAMMVRMFAADRPSTATGSTPTMRAYVAPGIEAWAVLALRARLRRWQIWQRAFGSRVIPWPYGPAQSAHHTRLVWVHKLGPDVDLPDLQADRVYKTYGPPCGSSPSPTTVSGCLNATATAGRPKHEHTSPCSLKRR